MKNIPEREQIPEMYLSGMSPSEIGKKVGLAPGAVYSILKTRGVPFRTCTESKRLINRRRIAEREEFLRLNPKPIPVAKPLTGFRAKLNDEEWLRSEVLQKSDYAIAADLGCAEGTVRYFRTKFGIEPPDSRLSDDSARIETREQYLFDGGSSFASFGMTGKTQSDLQRKRASEVNIGQRRNLGSTRTPEQRARMSAASMGKPGTNLGRKFTDEHKEKLRQANKGKKHNFTPDSLQRLKDARAQQVLPMRDSSIERKLQDELKKRGIAFRTHASELAGEPDIFIEPNICIFADGDYWHSFEHIKRHDAQVTAALGDLGYKVFRFTETAINRSPADCLDAVCSQGGRMQGAF